MQLQAQSQKYKDAGLSIVVLTYDKPELQQTFAQKRGFKEPLLSDVDATSVNNLGVRNVDYPPGDSNYGVAYPGVYIVSPDGIIRGKLYLEDLAERIDADHVLQYALSVLK